jgi:TolB-like protein
MRALLMSLFLVAGLWAQVKTVEVKVSAFGANRAEAVENALTRAVQQVCGMTLSSARAIVRTSTKGKVQVNDKKDVVKVTTTTQAKAIATSSHGAIESYRILKMTPQKGGYLAKLSVRVAYYKSPGLNPRKRRSLAVLPFEAKPYYVIDGQRLDGRGVSMRLTQAIVSKLTQTRKFTILDRQNRAYYEFEKRYMLTGDSDPVELARMGKLLGADYFVIGQIYDFGVKREGGGSTLIGAPAGSGEAKGFATVGYRILVVATQQIKWSDTIDIEFDLPHDKRPETMIARAGDKIAQVLTEQLLFNIYPPKVIQVHGENLTINIGGNFLHRGDRFTVYGLGEKLYDPYTKEPLGREETPKGKVEITSVSAKVSHARLLEGTAKKGDILRPEPVEDAPKAETGRDSMFDAMFQ